MLQYNNLVLSVFESAIKMEKFSLHKACFEVRLDTVINLIDKGINVNGRDSLNRTPLHCLSTASTLWNYWDATNRQLDIENKLTIAQLLLWKGANPNAVNDNGYTPLHMAVSNVNFEMVELLLKYGAKAWYRNNEGKTPMHIAARLNSTDILEKFLKISIAPDIIDYKGRTPLHEAICFQSQTRGIKILLDHGASVNWRDCKSRTPFLYCIKERKVALAAFLIENGADVSLPDEEGLTPLHYAVNNSDVNAIKLILDAKADANCLSKNGDSPLHLAVLKSNSRVIRLLLKYHADANLPNKLGETALHSALLHVTSPYEIISMLFYYNQDLKTAFTTEEHLVDIVKQPDFDGRTQKVVVRQALKLKAGRLVKFTGKVNEYLSHFDNQFYKRCLDEIVRIQENNLYHILTDSICKLSESMRNKKLEDKLFSFDYPRDFPLYRRMMEFKLKEACVRKKLLLQCEKGLWLFFNLSNTNIPYLPPECYPSILKYFNHRELQIFLELCNHLKIINRMVF